MYIYIHTCVCATYALQTILHMLNNILIYRYIHIYTYIYIHTYIYIYITSYLCSTDCIYVLAYVIQVVERETSLSDPDPAMSMYTCITHTLLTTLHTLNVIYLRCFEHILHTLYVIHVMYFESDSTSCTGLDCIHLMQYK